MKLNIIIVYYEATMNKYFFKKLEFPPPPLSLSLIINMYISIHSCDCIEIRRDNYFSAPNFHNLLKFYHTNCYASAITDNERIFVSVRDTITGLRISYGIWHFTRLLCTIHREMIIGKSRWWYYQFNYSIAQYETAQ